MAHGTIHFILDSNLGLPIQKEPWSELLADAGIVAQSTTDLVRVDRMLAENGPDIAYIPGADLCKLELLGNDRYRGVLINTSKFTGQARQRTLLVVKHDDPAESIDDLAGSTYGYMNASCSSSYFPPAIMANERGRRVGDFFEMKAVAGWQPRVDAVVAGTIRSTMILEDVWKMTPANAENAKVIGYFDDCPPAILAVKKTLDAGIGRTLRDHFLEWRPDWSNVYGAFRDYSYADVQTFQHEMSELPKDVLSA